jgi:D-glycero-alpha-D-manno-heptose-7-phosphate kinase
MCGQPKQQIICSSAPVRVCDIGGWTDTWFAVHGKVLNVAVRPAVEVELRAAPAAGRGPAVRIHATDLPAGDDPAHADPLLAAAVDSLPPPSDGPAESPENSFDFRGDSSRPNE